MKSLTGAIWGELRIGPIMGRDLKNPIMTPKKSPNRIRIPKSSIINPINAYLNKINATPRMKHTEPFSFCGGRLKKKLNVLWGPIIRNRPARNRILPKARRAESKNVMMPRMKKKTPRENKKSRC
jgi:hypothetical protein